MCTLWLERFDECCVIVVAHVYSVNTILSSSILNILTNTVDYATMYSTLCISTVVPPLCKQ